MEPLDDEKLTQTGVQRVLRRELGEHWRRVRWFGRQFTPTSVSVLLSLLGAAGTWIIKLNERVGEHTTEIRILREDVVPDREIRDTVAMLKQSNLDKEWRLQRLEGVFDDKFLNAQKEEARRRQWLTK